MIELLVLALLPIVLPLFGIVMHNKSKEKWMVRKYIHTVEFIIAALYGTYISSLANLFFVVGVFILFVVILSLIPKVQFIQKITEIGNREEDSKYSNLINMILTLSIAIILVLLLVDYKWIFMASMLVVGFGDTMGEIVGKIAGKHHYHILAKKSFEGSIGVFGGSFVALILAYVLFFAINLQIIMWLIAIAFILTVIEGASISMMDNLLMPVIAAGLLYIYVA